MAEVLLVAGLREVGVQAYPEPTGEGGRLAHQLAGDREGRTRRDRDLQHRRGRGIVPAGNGRLGGCQRRVPVLDDVVGGEASLTAPEVHGPARRVESQPNGTGPLDLGCQQVAAVPREHVVVVAGQGAAGAREPGEATAGGDVHGILVDPCPHRIERGQPLEERGIGGEPARHPLVEVVVGVDQAGGEQAARAVDHSCARDLGRGSLADGLDPVAHDDDVAVGQLGAGRVHGRDGTPLDDRAGGVGSRGREGRRGRGGHG